jgi:hypothetical protein
MFKETFLFFCNKPGNKHIAQEFALQKIEKIASRNNVSSVFEFGIGIGTIPYLLSQLNKKIVYFGTENNDFCINEFSKNVPNGNSLFDFSHLKNFIDYFGDTKFDFIIIDGEFNDDAFLKKIVHSNSIILVEGDRKKQRDFLQELFPKSLINHHISLNKNPKHSPFYNEKNNNFMGGYTIFRLNNSTKNKVVWFIEKAESFLKYRIRTLL